MMKKIIAFLSSLFLLCFAEARITSFGVPAEYGIKEFNGENFYDINTHTWDVFYSGDVDKMLGINEEHTTFVSTEYFSTLVIDGVKVGENAMATSLSDRGTFFGGDGYFDLCAYTPMESRYANQFRFTGGWKYNLNQYITLDLGGNFSYATKRVCGAGIPGAGITFSGDFYAGIIGNWKWISPFAYFSYNPDYDSQKMIFGIAPVISLEEITTIKNLFLEAEIYYGYLSANRYSGNNSMSYLPNDYWKNSYGYVQAEMRFIYKIDESWFVTLGGGYSYNNDGSGTVGKYGFDLGPNQNLWVSTSIGFAF